MSLRASFSAALRAALRAPFHAASAIVALIRGANSADPANTPNPANEA